MGSGQKKLQQLESEKNNSARVCTERNLTSVFYVVGGRIQKAQSYTKGDQEDDVYRIVLRKVGVKS